MKDHRCNCDSSCGENRYHDAGDHGCRFQSAEEFEAYWQNIRETNKKWIDQQMKPKEHRGADLDPKAQAAMNPNPTAPIYTIEMEVKRLRDALSTIGALFQKMPTVKEANVVVAWDIVDGALNGTWPAYGITPNSAKTYVPNNDG